MHPHSSIHKIQILHFSLVKLKLKCLMTEVWETLDQSLSCPDIAFCFFLFFFLHQYIIKGCCVKTTC